MLSDEELVELFRSAESDRVERKEKYSRSVGEDIRRAICAFANDLPDNKRPGVIFIGQTDDGRCANIEIDDNLLITLGGLHGDGKILPVPSMRVQCCQIDGCRVVAIIVAPAEQPPVRVDGHIWVRVGPRTTRASHADERRLTEKQIWQSVPFDRRPCADASLDDLDLRYFEREYLPAASSADVRRENGRTSEEKLRALRLLRPEGRPTTAAILLLGKDPRWYLSGAYLQFLRLDGQLLTDPIRDAHEISGTIADQVRQIEEILRLNISTRTQIGGGRRQERPDYPIAALEQLARNAILHRTYESSAPARISWYADRIEFFSPGGLYGDVTPQNIWRNVTAYRNPGLAEGMKTLGLIEQFGFGLVKTKQALAENNNPQIETEFNVESVLFTVRSAR